MSDARAEAERRYHAEDVDGIASAEFAQDAFMAGAEWQAAQSVSDAQVEAAARVLAELEPGEDWPTKEELGWSQVLGVQDDEYRSGMREEARAVLEAAREVQG